MSTNQIHDMITDQVTGQVNDISNQLNPANPGKNWKPTSDGGDTTDIPAGYEPTVGHWRPCKKHDYECMIHGDVCCESKKTF